MKTKQLLLAILLACFPFYADAQADDAALKEVVSTGLSRATEQSRLMIKELKNSDGQLPKTLDNTGKLVTSDYRWWCCGFFPGQLWYLYEYTQDKELQKMAELFTARVEEVKNATNTHDVGFMLYCSYGNGLRLTGRSAYKDVLITGAKSLATRYNLAIGAIRSWDHNAKVWKFPIIIDNMMNLELMLFAGNAVNDKTLIDMAISHADVTLKNHFRADNSCYHVVSYLPQNGKAELKQTAQGAYNESAWARGQAWALYGYTMMYRETKLDRYLVQAKKIALFLMNHPQLPADKIPYWDFDALDIPNEPKDASAAAIMASALLDLSQLDSTNFGKQCFDLAAQQLCSLTSPAYLAEAGANGNFILMHSTGHKPANSEVDVPLSYADYYYIEALMRLKNILNK